MTILGARPQFIKASVISNLLKTNKYKHKAKETILHTGQHFHSNMSLNFFNELNINTPKYNLGINNLSSGSMIGRMIEQIESIIKFENPDWMLLYGDTNSTLSGAIAGAQTKTPIAHVEAGVRSYNKSMPEEINRVLTDQVSHKLFTPTINATKNLIKEGFSKKDILNAGDVMLDVSLAHRNKAKKSRILNQLNLKTKKYVLCTVHRQSNLESKIHINNIIDALNETDETVILPLHPRTKSVLIEYNIKIPRNVFLIQPLGYIDMLSMVSNSRIVVTDSGGIQKESSFFNVPCLVLRKETEWPELVDNGCSVLVGTSKAKINNGLMKKKYNSRKTNLFGDGNAGKKIVNALLK